MGVLFSLLLLIDVLRMLLWKMKRCPRCRQFPAFNGWYLPSLNSGGDTSHDCTVNGERRDRPWVIVRCRQCGFELAIARAPVFGAG
jgi:hypothetical protein